MKLHQDEGVLHILHSLPTSRRKEKVNYFPTRQQQQVNETGSNRASLLGSMKSPSSYQSGGSPLLSIATQIAAQVSASSNAGFATGQRLAKKKEARNNLVK